ncbi:MAG: glycosyltransferase [Gammaproteobacteria bacterium]|jgi:glycosyltransferase involved in cell wall biosynthesis|nr:glycosyltransferase [Gammaproteobacteria bacterium]MBU1409128.1 glycosyltransferase [Gammaproteobacteria bacterium]MBU1531024.1 glycosyltransferase [Gammaproteobacteria bacterium]
MRYLFVSDSYPEFDRNSADFRLSQLMVAMMAYGEVDFWAIGEGRQAAAIGQDETRRYKKTLTESGVHIPPVGLSSVLKKQAYEAVFIEWYYSAAPQIDLIRSVRPQTKIITDSVDVVFNRLRAKAQVSGLPEDRRKADEVQNLELDTYRRSDLVLSVSDQDARILADEDASIRTFTIPNIHPLHDCITLSPDAPGTLVFVGSKSEANDDAMRYFCGQILPLILDQEPETIFRVVGTVELPKLDETISRSVERLGFVPDTRPYLESSLISVAPLRFGGGMKGKVGEAMSLGLPVVSTTTGAEGFGVESGREALVADDPQAFADAVVKLIREPELRENLRLAGWNFIRDNYSDRAVRKRVRELVDCIARINPKRPSWPRRAALGAKNLWDQHISWRLQ